MRARLLFAACLMCLVSWQARAEQHTPLIAGDPGIFQIAPTGAASGGDPERGGFSGDPALYGGEAPSSDQQQDSAHPKAADDPFAKFFEFTGKSSSTPATGDATAHGEQPSSPGDTAMGDGAETEATANTQETPAEKLLRLFGDSDETDESIGVIIGAGEDPKAHDHAEQEKAALKTGPLDKQEIEWLQDSLSDHGFDTGGVDGVWGPKSAAAMRASERAWGLAETGLPSRENYNRVMHQAPEASSQFVATAEGCSVRSSHNIPGQTPHWSGDCRNGKAAGEGRLEWRVARDGGGFIYSVYVGEMAAGEPHGRGVYDFQVHDPDAASRYEGAFRDGEIHGRGVYTWPSGARYDGEWSEGQRSGQGEMRYSDGLTYTGEWRESERNGTGVLSNAEGWYQSGLWKDNEFTGTGVAVYDDGDRYEGAFRDGERHGRGVFVWANGDRYDGEWREGERHGRGVKVWGPSSKWSGDRYDGEWREGERTGNGSYYFADGGSYSGQFYKGIFRGQGVRRWPDGDYYDGAWADHKPHGQGIARIDGDVRSGYWNYGCLRYGNGGKSAIGVNINTC